MQIAASFDLENQVYSHCHSPISTAHSLIACATKDARIRLCDIRSGGMAHSLTGHKDSIMQVQWSPRDDFLLASACQDGTIRLWDVRASSAANQLMIIDQHNGMVSRLFRQTDSSEIPIRSHQNTINAMQFTDDGFYLVSAGHDSRIRAWDVCSGKNCAVCFIPIFKV